MCRGWACIVTPWPSTAFHRDHTDYVTIPYSGRPGLFLVVQSQKQNLENLLSVQLGGAIGNSGDGSDRVAGADGGGGGSLERTRSVGCMGIFNGERWNVLRLISVYRASRYTGTWGTVRIWLTPDLLTDMLLAC